MMAGLGEIFALLIVFNAAFVLGDQKLNEKARDDCIKELKFNASEVVLVQGDRLYAQRKFIELPKGAQCFSQCFYKKLNLVGANNALDLKATKAALTEYYKGDAKKAETLMEKCKAEFTKGANECEKVFNYEICVHKV